MELRRRARRRGDLRTRHRGPGAGDRQPRRRRLYTQPHPASLRGDRAPGQRDARNPRRHALLRRSGSTRQIARSRHRRLRLAGAAQVRRDCVTPPTGPLDGIRVLELGTLIAGPFAGRLLGDMGADVIKIEPPGAPDPLRTWGQAEVDGHHVFWTVHARNKRAITLDLRRPPGRELFLELIEKSDIVVENFRPGTLEKWNLGYDVLNDRNPRIILVRVSGYGQTGPDALKAGYASVAEAASGLRHLNGFPGGPPPRLALSLGDSLAGMFGAQG